MNPLPPSLPPAGAAASSCRHLLTLNAGSSSLKFALYDAGPPLARIASGTVERIGSARATLILRRSGQQGAETEGVSAPDHVAAFKCLLGHLAGPAGDPGVDAIGHRVVHGGPLYHEPLRVDAAMLHELRRIRAFDPEHLPVEIALMEICAGMFPAVPQVACFDTAFHRDMPRIAKLLPLPRRYEAQGLRRYGFHGLSYTFLMEELTRAAGPQAAQGRVVLAHLGNGASLAAVHRGHCMDTTMAFTPASGLMMGTRSGDIDPGVIAFLAHSERMTAAQFDRLANHEAGMLGVSETSADMRDLLEREDRDVRAAEAVALFCQQVKKGIGAYAAVLGGLDTLVFAGGIGEHAAPVRARICQGLEFLGLELDERNNRENAGIISAPASRVVAYLMHTDEELVIAESTIRTLARSGRDKTS